MQVSIKMDTSTIKVEEISPTNKNSSGNKGSGINPFSLPEIERKSLKKKEKKKGVFDIFCCCD